MNSTIISYKNRGKYGNSKYRGNCSGHVIKDLINNYAPGFVVDFARGSDTTGDVCKELGVKHETRDLSIGFDLLNDEIEFKYDFCFYHPAYWDIIKYSGSMYGDRPHKSDISHIKDYDEFNRANNYIIGKQFASLKTGGRMAVLCGDIKKKGKLYSMVCDMQKFGTLEQIIIKEQHNCWSDNVKYTNGFIPIRHEYLVIMRKDNPFLYNIKITKDSTFDIRDGMKITWKDVIAAALEKLSTASTSEIYEAIRYHKKADSNNHVKEKIRQTLNNYKRIFKKVQNDRWCLI